MKTISIALAPGIFALAFCPPVIARVTRIFIDEVLPRHARVLQRISWQPGSHS